MMQLFPVILIRWIVIYPLDSVIQLLNNQGQANSQVWLVDECLKCVFFQLFPTIKVKLVDELMQSAFLCVILHVKHKKVPFIAILT